MSKPRKTFASTIRKDVRVRRSRKGVTVSYKDKYGTLQYRSQRANHNSAALLNSKIPVATILPPCQ
jgi:hypothetical protein